MITGEQRQAWATPLPNQRMKLSRRGGHLWWNAQGRPVFLIVAAPPRSLCAIR
jgi:hypothetical protein